MLEGWYRQPGAPDTVFSSDNKNQMTASCLKLLVARAFHLNLRRLEKPVALTAWQTLALHRTPSLPAPEVSKLE